MADRGEEANAPDYTAAGKGECRAACVPLDQTLTSRLQACAGRMLGWNARGSVSGQAAAREE